MAKNTAIQKILRNHIVSGSEVAGEPVAIRIDQTLTQDATGTMAYLELVYPHSIRHMNKAF